MGTKNLVQPFDLRQAKVTTEDFGFVQEKILDIAGISLSDAKQELVKSRLRSRISALGMEGLSDYRSYLETLSPSDPEWQIFTNLLTTNKTDWFREPQHFEILAQEYLPQWKALNRSTLNVWCAASSTGEEPYSLALLLDTELRDSNTTFNILATDIDTKVLDVARRGVYHKDRIRQIPEQYRQNGFDFGTKEISSWVRVKNRIKERVRFERFNLAQSTYPWRDKFDLIFCRNVLIYFSAKTTQTVVERAFATGASESALFIAHSESLQNIKTSWMYVKPSIYRKGGRISWPLNR